MSRLGLSERVAIEAAIYRKSSFAEIAKQLGIQPRAVSDEIRRNRTLAPAPRFNGKDCRFASECHRQYVCKNPKLFPVILTDNGSEFKYTLEMERTVDGSQRTKIFYCDPQASWQKPHIEKNHEYIRYVIPKGKSLDPYTQEDFTLLANHINSTKRMQYNGKAPIELATSEEFRVLLEVTGTRPVHADAVVLTRRLLGK